jgi:exonuclease VII small subunit
MTFDPIDRTADWPQDASELDENDADDWTLDEPDGDEDENPRERLWQAVYRLESEVDQLETEFTQVEKAHNAAAYKQTILKLKSQLADLYEKLSHPTERPVE